MIQLFKISGNSIF